MRDSIDFLLGDEAVSVSGIPPDLTVLEWLRTFADRVGTKEGCAEGDCGACTVVVAERSGAGLRYRAVNSCIQLMATLDGRQLITVEDLAVHGRNGTPVLHGVQKAMVEQHGSQCGFCTPGFVMSMFAMTHDASIGADDTSAINEALAGNLCRCTGYVPIVKAARQALESSEPDRFSAAERKTIEKLKSLPQPDSLRLGGGERQIVVPRTLDELLGFLGQYPDAVMVAGATDVGLWLTKELKRFDTLIYVGEVAELLDMEEGPEFIDIGAAVTYSDAMPLLLTHYPELEPVLSRLGGWQVRNAGTIGGNIANGSPIGDSPPPLIVLGARLVITGPKGSREIDLEDYFIEYGKQDLRPGECVHAVRIPKPVAGQLFRAYKVSKRFDQDISAVLGAFAVTLHDGKVSSIRMAFGGLAGVPARARAAEAALKDQDWCRESVDKACLAMGEDFTPLTDWRASAEYRLLCAQNLLRRFFNDCSGRGDE